MVVLALFLDIQFLADLLLFCAWVIWDRQQELQCE